MESLIETTPGTLTARNATLKELVEGAYSLEKYQVIGGRNGSTRCDWKYRGELPAPLAGNNSC